MDIKPNDVNMAYFMESNWAKEDPERYYEPLHTKIITWLLNPNGDHLLGYDFYRAFLQCAGVASEDADLIETLHHEYKVAVDEQTNRIPDIYLETKGHLILVENKTRHGYLNQQSIDELSDQLQWLEYVNSKKEKMIIFISPIVILPKGIHAFLEEHKQGIRVIFWQDIAHILEDLMLNKYYLEKCPQQYKMLERYLWFVRIYIMNYWDANYLESRLESIETVFSRRKECMMEWMDRKYGEDWEETRKNDE